MEPIWHHRAKNRAKGNFGWATNKSWIWKNIENENLNFGPVTYTRQRAVMRKKKELDEPPPERKLDE